jgi:hypothetical protein
MSKLNAEERYHVIENTPERIRHIILKALEKGEKDSVIQILVAELGSTNATLNLKLMEDVNRAIDHYRMTGNFSLIAAIVRRFLEVMSTLGEEEKNNRFLSTMSNWAKQMREFSALPEHVRAHLLTQARKEI